MPLLPRIVRIGVVLVELSASASVTPSNIETQLISCC
jgi:hypothetical protein